MKTYRDFITITTDESFEVRDITPEISQLLAKSGIKEGMVLLFPHHTSAAVYISDSDRSLADDVLDFIKQLVPEGTYRHDLSDSRKNARAHLMSLFAGHNATLPVTEGSLDLGVYQTVYYADFDGRRKKEVLVKIIGE